MHADAKAGPFWSVYAREVIERAVRGDETRIIPAPEDAPQSHGGVFVTLKKYGQLRGCMGTLDSTRRVAQAVRQAASTAALHDPRFSPVKIDELPDLTIEVSILSEPWPMHDLDELELGRHGIIVRCGMQHGLFLPQVASEHHLDKETFLSRCCSEKAGLPADAWRSPETQVLLFTTQIFSDQTSKPGN
ncbi:MAG: AmmeMemoRadiSam system protein A [Planctomycetota bacterium]